MTTTREKTPEVVEPTDRGAGGEHLKPSVREEAARGAERCAGQDTSDLASPQAQSMLDRS